MKYRLKISFSTKDNSEYLHLYPLHIDDKNKRIGISQCTYKKQPIGTFLINFLNTNFNDKKIAKEYFDTNINSAAPIATMICVRRPASFCLRLRSKPIRAPHTPASTTLNMHSQVVSIPSITQYPIKNTPYIYYSAIITKLY